MGRGDHIQVYRGGYHHHGIDLGNDMVVHFTGRPDAAFNKGDAIIRKTALADFTGNERYEVVTYSQDKALHPDHVCIRALSSIGRSGYNLFSNNCEHFAASCKTGTGKSKQVTESYERIWKMSKFGIRHPGFFLAGPLFELLRRGTLYGWHWMKQMEQSDDSLTSEAPSQNSQCTAFFRALFGYTGADSLTYVQNFEKQWFVWDATRGAIQIEGPNANLTYTFRVWIDDNHVQYFETQTGWQVATHSGTAPLSPHALSGGTFQARISTPQSAPLGALNAIIEVPTDLDELLAAVNEVAARGVGDLMTYRLLRTLAEMDSGRIASQMKNAHDTGRGAAVWTLAVISAVQFHAYPTEKLPALPTIVRVLFNEGEREELRIIALKAVQALNRPSDVLARGILEKASALNNQVVREAAGRLLRGESLIRQ